MSSNALKCGLAAMFGLGATVFSFSNAQTPLLPDMALAERAIEPIVEPVALLESPIVSAVVPVAQKKVAVKPFITPLKSVVVKPSVKAASKPVVRKTVVARITPVKRSSVKRAVIVKAPAVRYVRASTARSYTVRSTAYNSVPGQTDSSPFVTATGTRTRFGVVALSRDLLRFIPYGSRIKIQDLSGSSYNRMLVNTVFVVEDTMNARMRGKVDVWMSTRSQAMNWGSRSIRITVLN